MNNNSSKHTCLQCFNETMNPKFCSRSCSATYNNTIMPKRQRQVWVFNCSRCNKPQKKKSLSGLCSICWNDEQDKIAGEMTLGESIKEFANPRSRYNTVRHHGRKLSKIYNQCQVCGYDKVLQVCHIRPVSSFPLDTQIKEINAPDNIAILCPNHHCELDRGLLAPSEIPNRAA